MSEATYDPSAIKTFFSPALVREISADLKAVYAGFDASGFEAFACNGLEDLELKDRALLICGGFGRFLPDDFETAATTLLESMGEPEPAGGMEGMGGFKFLPHVSFLSEFGRATPEPALRLMKDYTRYFSCEFPIRFFIIDDEAHAMSHVRAWAEDDDWRVRRLASEGTRPRLPWAQQLKSFMADPSPVIDVLDGMHDDPELIVRRSVANNLNDIAKDHPDRAAKVAGRWHSNGTPGSQWTVKHGLRTLIKQGHKEALAVLGYKGGEGVEVQGVSLSDLNPIIGGSANLNFTLENTESQPVNMVVDYALRRTLANGKTGEKVFKLKLLTMKPGAKTDLKTTLKFKQLSTRTYYPGPHGIRVLINGREAASLDFDLKSA